MYIKLPAKRIIKIWILILLLLCMSYSVTSIAENDFKIFRESSKEYVEGEILVKFKKTTSDFSIMGTVNILNSNTIKEIGGEKLYLLKVREGQNVKDTVKEFEEFPNVEYAQPNFIYKLMSTSPNDTHYSNLWGLKNSGQTISNSSYNKNNPGISGMDMDMELAWDYVTDCSSVVVAVIDTGINYNHVDLAGNMWNGAVNHGYDFVDDDNDPMDLHGHGTHVAGTIGAVGNNSIGTVGLCWDVQIMAVRVFDAAGNSTTADIILGINYAVNNGAKILNMSFGGYNFDQAEYEAIGYAKNNDVIVVAAAGNNSTDSDTEFHHYPSDFDHNNIISVAALDQSYELASFSNYGNVSVDVGAPGTNIQSEWNGTEIIITDTLTSGWTEGGTLGWEYIVKDLGYGNENILAVPFNWGPPSWGLYEANAYDRIWKTFNLNGYDGAILNYWFWLDVETGYDIFATYCDNSTSDPFFSGTQLAGWTGSTDDYFILESCELPSNTITSTCTIGFALWSDDNYQQYGIAILDFSISAISLNYTSYGIINGTSMAAPHVTGLAALIWAFNPSYNYKEVIESIKDGGKLRQALDGKVSTGKAVNAWGSLRYITQPTGVTIINN